MTAVEWLEDNLISETWAEEHFKHNSECWDKAKEMASKERTRKQLFIGKVSEIIGFDKTLELLKECNNTIK
jgi:hypothetical protein